MISDMSRVQQMNDTVKDKLNTFFTEAFQFVSVCNKDNSIIEQNEWVVECVDPNYQYTNGWNARKNQHVYSPVERRHNLRIRTTLTESYQHRKRDQTKQSLLWEPQGVYGKATDRDPIVIRISQWILVSVEWEHRKVLEISFEGFRC